MLFLGYTKVTDAGLVHLKGLTSIQMLSLNGTDVTDDGLKYLKEFTNLQLLYLNGTKATKAGIEKLQNALPRCKIVTFGHVTPHIIILEEEEAKLLGTRS